MKWRRAVVLPLVPLALLAGCGSSPTSTNPGGGGQTGITVTGTTSAPTTLNIPGGGTDSIGPDQLLAALDVAQPVPADQEGAIGLVTATSATGFTLQIPNLLGAPGSPPTGFTMHSYPRLATPGTTVTVTTTSGTTFENGATLASIPVHALVAIGGTGSGSAITANYVAVLATATGSVRTGREPPPFPVASTLPTRASANLVNVIDTVPGVLTLVQNFPPQSISDPVLTWIPVGKCPKVEIRPQYGVGLGLRYSFPYDVIYQDHPPLYGEVNGVWGGPGDYSGWLAFQREPPAGNAMSVNYGGGLAIGVGLQITGCDTKVLQLAATGFGYFVQSTSVHQMPAYAQSDTLETPNCQSLVSFPLFDGFPGGLEVGPFSASSNLAIVACDPAIVTGGSVTAQLTELLGGSGGSGQFVFNQMTGVPTQQPTLLNPNDSTMFFKLSSIAYPTTFQDRLQITTILLGQKLSDGKVTPIFSPRSLTATAQAERLQIFGMVPTQLCAEVPGDQFDDASSGARNPACSPVVNHGPGNGTGTPIAVEAVELCNAPYCPSSAPGFTISSTVQVTVRENNYNGVFRALDVPGAIPGTATILKPIYDGDATLCGNPNYQVTNPVSISAPTPLGNTAQATFTISIGGYGNGNNQCHIYLVDENYGAVLLNLRLLGGG